MKLWKIEQDINGGWDTYSDAIVAAETEEEARLIHPDNSYDSGDPQSWSSGTWAAPQHVQVKLIGIAVKGTTPGVICASFNAG